MSVDTFTNLTASYLTIGRGTFQIGGAGTRYLSSNGAAPATGDLTFSTAGSASGWGILNLNTASDGSSASRI